MVGEDELRALHAVVGGFHLRERAIVRAHAAMTRLLAAGGEPSAAEAAAYREAVRRYFAAFEREAAAHLRSLDERLARVGQVQFNLSAERGVTAKRIEATRGVLAQLGIRGSP